MDEELYLVLGKWLQEKLNLNYLPIVTNVIFHEPYEGFSYSEYTSEPGSSGSYEICYYGTVGMDQYYDLEIEDFGQFMRDLVRLAKE